MIFKQYEHDIKCSGYSLLTNGEAKNKIEADDRLKDFVDNNPCVKTTLTLWVTARVP
jgi:hypothetical protein